MGIIDVETKEYVRRPEVFADLFNYLLYKGKTIIKPDNLSVLDTTEIALLFSEEQKEEQEDETGNRSKRGRKEKKNQRKQSENKQSEGEQGEGEQDEEEKIEGIQMRKEFIQKYRDILKKAVIMKDDKITYMLILGVENQSRIHYAMPVKNMIYDDTWVKRSCRLVVLARKRLYAPL